VADAGNAFASSIFLPRRRTEARSKRERVQSTAVEYNKDGRHFGYDLAGVGRTRYYTSEPGLQSAPEQQRLQRIFPLQLRAEAEARLISWRVYDAMNTPSIGKAVHRMTTMRLRYIQLFRGRLISEQE